MEDPNTIKDISYGNEKNKGKLLNTLDCAVIVNPINAPTIIPNIPALNTKTVASNI